MSDKATILLMLASLIMGIYLGFLMGLGVAGNSWERKCVKQGVAKYIQVGEYGNEVKWEWAVTNK